jgi:hypothetical protein
MGVSFSYLIDSKDNWSIFCSHSLCIWEIIITQLVNKCRAFIETEHPLSFPKKSFIAVCSKTLLHFQVLSIHNQFWPFPVKNFQFCLPPTIQMYQDLKLNPLNWWIKKRLIINLDSVILSTTNKPENYNIYCKEMLRYNTVNFRVKFVFTTALCCPFKSHWAM